MTWMSKMRGGTAHYVMSGNGRSYSLCSTVFMRDGKTPVLSAFTATFVTRDPDDHLCNICKRVLRSFENRACDEACVCLRCGVKVRTK